MPLTVVPGPASGPGEAYLEGFRRVVEAGTADVVVTLDANGRHDPTEIPSLIDHLTRRGSHVVIGSRWTAGSGTPGLSPSRWILGRLANLAFRWVTASPQIGDATTSFRVARVELIRDFDLGSTAIDPYSVHTTFVAKAIAQGYRVGEAPIIYRPPLAGGGGLTMGDIREFGAHLLALRREMQRIRHRRLSPTGRAFDVDHFGADDDIECLAASKYFFDWVLEEFEPYLRGRVLEVGAGTGTITRKLVERSPDVSVVALEPAGNMFAGLEAYAALTDRVVARRETLAEHVGRPEDAFDAVLYVNVLEHIADDEREVRLAAQALRPGGALLVFGPALEALYGDSTTRPATTAGTRCAVSADRRSGGSSRDLPPVLRRARGVALPGRLPMAASHRDLRLDDLGVRPRDRPSEPPDPARRPPSTRRKERHPRGAEGVDPAGSISRRGKREAGEGGTRGSCVVGGEREGGIGSRWAAGKRAERGKGARMEGRFRAG